ncbi:unnamed protein product [Chondrus crispus]|uniref:Uncharacterized protein n=1 Tax=Chondrus crispus TaxID=2769 RepID=R7QDK0_CHOCR|nr:unnamed protein product [Chondrus crispus]CDF36164.1 unnamed protein product [Chondrus crispus]|eukprot:XP_005715983.1 unnamed protein product [Chondrus crispus]
MCTLTCKVDFGRYHCTEKANNGECVCAPQQPQVVVKPVASELGPGPLLGGQSDLNGPQEQTCVDKPVGFQFPDAVPCVSIRADVVKERVHFIMGKTDDCTVRTGEAPETRYMETTPDNVGLQGCVYVCKMKAPKCTGPKAEGKCRCASPGISKQLVAMSQLAGTTRLVEKCTSDKGCEPCGFCKNSVCELKKEAHLGSNCDCGKICPAKDYRLRKTGASISCEPNFSMDCMARPDWMDMKTAPNGKATSFLDGTEVPDLCTAGPTDASDMCGCAPGYEERLVSNDTERVCVKPSPLPAPTKPQDAMPEEGDVAPVEILPEAGGTIGKD